jgi:GxxExxY protein
VKSLREQIGEGLTTEFAEANEARQMVMQINELTEAVMGAAIEVHRFLGPGLLESTYETCLCHELSKREIPFRRQVTLSISYKGLLLESGYIIDILVDDRLILELKAVEQIQGIHEAQLLTYLKLSQIDHGLLLNFNVELLKDGIKRRIRKQSTADRSSSSSSAPSVVSP